MRTAARERPKSGLLASRFYAAVALTALALTAAGCANAPTEDLSDDDTSSAFDIAQAETTSGDATAKDVVLECPGGTGCECEANDDCDAGICLEFPEGKKCAQSCIADCPASTSCADVPVGVDLVQVCVARWGFICEPCTSSDQCAKAVGSHGSACIAYGPELGSFCGSACTEDNECPTGYGCREESTVEGAAKKACVRVDGDNKIECLCDARAAKLQLATTCEVQAEKGICGGNRVCGADGLSPCSAAPVDEVCDGKDNDCNGLTDDALCDDTNPCTDDSCVAGTADCKFVANTLPCDDENACTNSDTCAATKCEGATIDCDDKNLCTEDACAAKSGCVYVQTNKACDDDNLCTDNDLCDGNGACVGLALQASVTCNDNNVCTKDGCDPNKLGTDGKTGCFSEAQTGACEDGDPCTNGDGCTDGKCVGGGNICACLKDEDCAKKEDGDLCNGTLFCNKAKAPYFCEIDPKTLINCDTSKDSTCSKTVCDGKKGECVAKPEPTGKPCDADGSVCTLSDACTLGVCSPGKGLDCDDGNVCSDDSCDAKKGCQNLDNFSACEDGNLCTKSDTCALGNCKPGNKLLCDDKEGCTFDFCDKKTGTCAHEGASHDGDPCDADGSVCTAPDNCADGKCAAGKQKVCDDNNLCTKDGCDPKSGCTATFDNQAKCDADGKKCTPHDFCSNGQCKLGGPKNCDDGNTCTVDSCDGNTGGCIHKSASLDGETCDADGSLCTEVDKCKAGKCVAGAAPNCDDKNECTKDSCKPKSGCIQDKLTETPCDDGDKCTVKDICVVGKCGGIKLNCEDNNPCTNDVCDGGCKHPVVSNGTNCGTGKHCVVGKCVVASCGDGYVAKGEQCDDGNANSCDGCEACVRKQHLLLDGKTDVRAAAKSPNGGGLSGALSIVGDMTIEAWVRFTKLGTDQTIVSKASLKAPQLVGYRFGVSTSGALFFAHKREDILEVVIPKNTGKAKVTAGVWGHLAVVISGDAVRMFIDGQPAGTGKLYKSRVDSPNADVVIGKAWSDAPGGELVGSVDAVHIAAVPLYGGPFTPLRRRHAVRGSVSLWHMDDSASGKVQDEGHAGIALSVGAAKLAADGCYGAKPDESVCGDGKVSSKLETCDDKNGALCDACEGCQSRRTFDPTATGVYKTNSATEWAPDVLCPTCTFTLEAWVRPSETTGIQEVIGASCGVLSLALVQGAQGTRFGVVALGTPLLLGSTPIKKNAWYHVAGVAGFEKGAPMRIYVNGKLEGETTAPYGVGGSGGSQAQMHKEILFIGAGAAGTGGGCVSQGQTPQYKNQFKGQIDEVRVSAGQRYGSSFTAPRYLYPDGATRGLWHFDDVTGKVIDDSGHNVGGSLVGGKFHPDKCYGESASSAICGDAQKATWEACDNGAANGVSPKQCSAVCAVNSKADCHALAWAKGKVPTGKNVMQYGKQWTIEGWVRLPVLPKASWGPIAAVHAKALCPSMPAGQHWYIGVGADGDDASRIGGAKQVASVTKRVWRAGVWQHFALQYNGGNEGSLWVDGTLARTFTGVDEGWSASCSLNLGGFFDGNSYTLGAELASIRLSKRARYGQAFAPPTSMTVDNDTVWSFDFDEGTGATAKDADGIYQVDASKATWIKKGPACTK